MSVCTVGQVVLSRESGLQVSELLEVFLHFCLNLGWEGRCFLSNQTVSFGSFYNILFKQKQTNSVLIWAKYFGEHRDYMQHLVLD